MLIRASLTFITRAYKFFKKMLRKFNVAINRTSSCDRVKFNAVIQNPLLKSKLVEMCSGVYSWDNFLSGDECKSIISVSKNRVKRSDVAGVSKRLTTSHRTSYGVTINDETLKETTDKIRSSIFEITQLPVQNQEDIRVIRYRKGQQFKIHHDCHTPVKDGKESKYFKHGGQRIFSCIIYLNDGFKGGKTNFPALKISSKPETGRLVIWNNVDGHNVKSEMIHSSEPVIEGEKWAITLWVRESEYNTNN